VRAPAPTTTPLSGRMPPPSTRRAGPAVAYFLGQGTAEEVMAAADQGSKAERLQQGCEAGFYLGEAALLKGDRSTAEAEFRKVLTDCDLYRGNYVYISRAYGAAAAELKRLP